jgi:FtsP/CotA-like multicopper oxidase with cupredoxin domain
VALRRLRLIAQLDSGGGGSEEQPAYRYLLEESGRSTPRDSSLPGPLILLKRGEPVGITVVNQLPEPTAVHWHGIELDSYMDGVAGFSGHPGRIAPAIAPRDSFEARFTPPRSGTFIYHPHADEVRQQQAGLSGALLVVDDPAAFDPAHDLVLLLSTPRREADAAGKVLLNGSLAPAPLELRVGERYRFRLINIHTNRPSMILRLVRDSTPLTWRAVAKDGMDLPAERATTRPAVQQTSNGETYDFEFTPREPGEFRIAVTGIGGVLVAMPVRVR